MDNKLGLKFKSVKIDFIFSFFVNKEQSLANFLEKYPIIPETKDGMHEVLSLKNILCCDLSKTVNPIDINRTSSCNDIYMNKFKFTARNDINNHCNNSLKDIKNLSIKESDNFYERCFCKDYTRRVILPNLRVKKHECFKKLDFGRYIIKLKDNTDKINWDKIVETNRLEGLVRIMDSGIGTFKYSPSFNHWEWFFSLNTMLQIHTTQMVLVYPDSDEFSDYCSSSYIPLCLLQVCSHPQPAKCKCTLV